MSHSLILIFGSGLAAALFFMIPLQGAAGASFFLALTPLPLMISHITLGSLQGLYATGIGVIVLSFVIHPLGIIPFLAFIGLPAWILGIFATKFPPRLSVMVCVGLACFLSLSLLGFSLFHLGSYQNFLQIMSHHFSDLLHTIEEKQTIPFGWETEDLSSRLAVSLPPLLTGWYVFILCLNLWLAARIAVISGTWPRKWKNLPDALRFPMGWGLCFVLFMIAFFSQEGLISLIAGILTMGFALSFSFQGLGALHSMTRSLSFRSPLLFLFYFLLVLFPPLPLLFICLLGLLDMFISLPRQPLDSLNP